MLTLDGANETTSFLAATAGYDAFLADATAAASEADFGGAAPQGRRLSAPTPSPAAADLPTAGWLVEVEASLPDHAAVPLDPRLSVVRTSIGEGGAADVALKLKRATREVILQLSAADTAPWVGEMEMPDVPIEVRHVTGAAVSADGTAGTDANPIVVTAVAGERPARSVCAYSISAGRGGRL